MKFINTLIILAPFLSSTAFAEPEAEALSVLPTLSGFNGRSGMTFVDPDGIYRAYLTDGTVIDAVRLTRPQILAFVNARAPHLSASEAAAERTLYANIDSRTVSDEHLLAPAAELKPRALLESMEAFEKVRRDAGGLVEERAACPAYNCVNTPYVCTGKKCICNTTKCQKIN